MARSMLVVQLQPRLCCCKEIRLWLASDHSLLSDRLLGFTDLIQRPKSRHWTRPQTRLALLKSGPERMATIDQTLVSLLWQSGRRDPT